MEQNVAEVKIEEFVVETRSKAYSYAKSRRSTESEAQDFAQTATISIVGGRKATMEQLYTDYLRSVAGDVRHPNSMMNKTSHYGDMVEIENMLPNHPTGAEACDFGAMIQTTKGEERAMLVLKYQWDLTEKEIGYCLGVSEGRISQRLTEIKKKLKKRLGKEN